MLCMLNQNEQINLAFILSTVVESLPALDI